MRGRAVESGEMIQVWEEEEEEMRDFEIEKLKYVILLYEIDEWWSTWWRGSVGEEVEDEEAEESEDRNEVNELVRWWRRRGETVRFGSIVFIGEERL